VKASIEEIHVGTTTIFDVGVNDRLPASQLLILGLQNVFGMTGMFVFPGLLGRSFDLQAQQIAYVYGMTFVVCGITTILQSVLLLRLPVVQGPYAGCFAALLAVGHLQSGGLGAAYGSFLLAALVWCLLTVSIGGFSVIGLFCPILTRANHVRHDYRFDHDSNRERGASQLDWFAY
jgi:xanthine/uracil permease